MWSRRSATCSIRREWSLGPGLGTAHLRQRAVVYHLPEGNLVLTLTDDEHLYHQGPPYTPHTIVRDGSGLAKRA